MFLGLLFMYKNMQLKRISETSAADLSAEDDIVAERLYSKIKFISESDEFFINKEKNEFSKIDNIPVGSDKFTDLMNLHLFNKKSLIKTMEILKLYDDVTSAASSVESENAAVDSFLIAMNINRDTVKNYEKNKERYKS